MKDYIINKKTLAIISCDYNKSLIYEGNKMIIVKNRPNLIINKNCIINGSTFLGRRKCSENIIGSSYKAPILIGEKDNLIFFPTSSPRLKNVSWINLINVDKIYYNNLKKVTIVVFKNGVTIEFDVSLNIMNNQILRATRLEHCLRQK